VIMKEVRRELRFFELMRDEDISGVSGIGLVAVGVVFPSGRVVLEWLGSRSTFGIYNNLADVERIHGHDGKTRVLFSKGTTCNSYLAFQRPRAKSVLQGRRANRH